MTEEALTSLAVEDTPNPGTVSFTPEPKEPVKPPTAREAIEKSLEAIEEKDGKIPEVEDIREKKPDPKAKEVKIEDKAVEEKPKVVEPKVDLKQAVETNDEAAPVDPPKPPSGDRDINRAPDNFLPRAKEKWADAPEEVRGEFYRALDNFEKGKQEYHQDREFRKELKPFEEMAQQAGVTVKQALENYTAIDRLLKQSPEEGIERVLKSVGISPVDYAKHILGKEQQLQQNPALAHTQRLEQQVQQLTQQIQGFTQAQTQAQQQAAQQQAIQQVENTLFAEVRQQHPRFDELRPDVAFFFNSDKLSSIVDERSRLFAAVDMAERINPASQSHTTRSAQRPVNPAGEKSIKGSLTNGTDVYAGKGVKLSSREAIEAAMNQLDIRS